MSSEAEAVPGVTRREVRPGLTMIKRVTVKEDGRRLIYYGFEPRVPLRRMKDEG